MSDEQKEIEPTETTNTFSKEVQRKDILDLTTELRQSRTVASVQIRVLKDLSTVSRELIKELGAMKELTNSIKDLSRRMQEERRRG